ncbi:hypothetical protein ACJ73_01395 [Blastomyces percursus]|uniref:Uncharacterized protein n=1 Tax=Blastomyces percursus TaxID=1658174 RepID=A0A1J9R4B5_9EURO|nr:hypothetical protein ACJ73_01395 [Blastomyces percursus]
MDGQSRFDGATSYEIRDHFVSWVVDVPKRVQTAKLEKFDLAIIQRNEGPDELNSCAETLCLSSGLFGARYGFCLFVDDICLESLDHMSSPVVKILEETLVIWIQRREGTLYNQDLRMAARQSIMRMWDGC